MIKIINIRQKMTVLYQIKAQIWYKTVNLLFYQKLPLNLIKKWLKRSFSDGFSLFFFIESYRIVDKNSSIHHIYQTVLIDAR